MKTQTLTLLALIGLLALALLTLPAPAPAQWGSTPDDPLPICTADGNQAGQLIFRLGSGRYLITWTDEREASGIYRAYYQLVTAKGEVLLVENGQKVFPNSIWRSSPYFLVSDNQGGCIAILSDDRNGAFDVYGQRFDSLGNRLWGDTGLPLVLWPGTTENVWLHDAKIDNDGNIFLAWIRGLDPGNEMYIQKATIDGQLLWGNYGVMEYSGSVLWDWQHITPDNQGGLLDVWKPGESDPLRAQHLNSIGTLLWSSSGVPLLTPQGSQIICDLISTFPDGSGGGICVGNYNGGIGWWPKIFRVNGNTGQVLWYWVYGQAYDSYFVTAL